MKTIFNAAVPHAWLIFVVSLYGKMGRCGGERLQAL
jgi:hypothetical protein